MTTDAERAAFEAWAMTQPRHEGVNTRFLALNNAYIDFELHGAWLAWQARAQQAPAGSAQPVALTDAARDVLAERRRQIEVEGWTPEHDDKHSTQELAFAAACYVLADQGDAPPAVWPWDTSWWKPKDQRCNLIKAGALILAEIERLDRLAKIDALKEPK
jgi:hypothetical protein